MAVLGILLLMPHLPRWEPILQSDNLLWRIKMWGIGVLQDLLRVSLSAQIGTLPLVLYYFHLLPTYALLISLWIIPLAGIVLGIALLFFLMPFAESLLGSILSNVVGLMNAGLECFSNLPLATIEMPITFPTAILLYLLPPLIIWGMGHYSRRMKMIVGIGVIIVSIGILESLTMMV
jgi:competence protein ComEC